MKNLIDCFKRTEEIVKEAGKIAEYYFNTTSSVGEKEDNEPVTEADIKTNQFLKENLMELIPEAGWLSEETNEDLVRLEKEYVWIVDPLDGTKEFIKRIPEFSISVALVKDKSPLIGVVHNPITKETISGFHKGGIYYNSLKVEMKEKSANKKLIMLSSRTDTELGYFERYKEEFEIIPVGSIAYKLAKIAIGHGDLVLSETRKKEWDICAGVFLIREAGGFIEHLDGSKPTFNNANPVTYKGIIASLHSTPKEKILSFYKNERKR